MEIKENLEELRNEVDLRTGLSFKIMGLSPYDSHYGKAYSRMMYLRFRDPIKFWSDVMQEEMPKQEIDYLISKGYFKREK